MSQREYLRQLPSHQRGPGNLDLAFRLHIDMPLLAGLLATMGFGLLVLYSAGGESMDLVLRQLTRFLLGFIVLFFREQIVDVIAFTTGQEIWDPEVRFLSTLPSRTDPWEVFGIVMLALVLSFLATLYPALKAANTDPVQVLRYE